jgi:UDP-glucose 4-epimerase
MTVLVTGGAGYIGSHVTYALLDRGDQVVVLDNLSTGRRSQISANATFIEGEVSDQELVRNIIAEHGIESVLHFAGSIVVPESVKEPLLYYRNNVAATRSLMEACVAGGVDKFIFSSTGTVFAEDAPQPLSEDARKAPISPYARSKLMTEWMLEDASGAYNFRYAILRYFNVCGADPLGRAGQISPVPTHLIKRALMVGLGRIPQLDIYGTDYPTPDGTGIRDYIHVTDLAMAHILALDALRDGAASASYNCGYGRGLSVREIVAAVERVVGKRLPVRDAPRRPGDPPVLIADPTRIKMALGWQPKHDDIRDIVATALEWERRANA